MHRCESLNIFASESSLNTAAGHTVNQIILHSVSYRASYKQLSNMVWYVPYRAFMRFLPCVSPHVHHQHVLSLEGLLLTRTLIPATHKLLLLTVDVVIVDVLKR